MATLMQWDPRLDIGVHEMNEQHRQLLELMNKVYELTHPSAAKSLPLSAEQGSEVVAAVVQLESYTLQHFTAEESYMASIHYPEIESHKQTHAALRKSLSEFRESIVHNHGEVPAKFFAFLKFWLASHICGIDHKYGAYSKTLKAA